MDLNLVGKTVIVTGGGSNIGRAIVLAFAGEKSNIVIADIDEEQSQRVVKQAGSIGGRAISVKTDVTSFDSVASMVNRTIEEFGKPDVLVNSVGWTLDRLFIEKPRVEWQKEVDLNFWGVLNCIKAVIDHMIEHKYGKIISIGSDAGRMGEYKEAVYAACKGGVMAMSKSIAREVGRYGINVNVVCPGVTVPENPDYAGDLSMWKGPMAQVFTPEAQEKAAKSYPLRRLGKPEDVANAVVFLASDAANFITGQTISVSGGYTMM
jgi:2-hydroxycyclohexanecarboxyl-CoA dehydrogenase